MHTIIKKSLLLTFAALLLSGASACTNAQTPNMVDYSYVPTPNVMAPEPDPGIDWW